MTARTLADVQAFVDALGPVPAGCQRVFRGQTRAYTRPDGRPAITPALKRRGAPYDAGWLVRLTHLLQLANAPGATGVSMDVPLVWAPALIQHYGPGSYFIDVTFDVGVALWFALHTWHQRWLSSMVARGGDEAYERWMPTAWYTPREPDPDHPAVLYVFDLPLWDGVVAPRGVEIVDLRQTPTGRWLEGQATRLGAQHGALLHARWLEDGDVGPLAVASLELAEDFETAAAVAHRTTADIFPPPQADPMYMLLLSWPARQRLEPTRLQHPLDVPWYLSAKPHFWAAAGAHAEGGAGTASAPSTVAIDGDGPWRDELDGYLRLCTMVTPPLLPAHLGRRARVDGADGERRLGDALVVLMDGPLQISTPPVPDEDDGAWIESALPLGIAPQLAGRSTANVFVEFSPVDYVSLDGRWGPTPRAAWVISAPPHYHVRVYFQDGQAVRGDDVRLTLDSTSGRFRGDAPWQRTEPARKALFVVLALLRDASPGLKVPVLCAFTVGSGDERRQHLASPVIGQRTRLVPVARHRYLQPVALDGRPYTLGVRPDDQEYPADEGFAAVIRDLPAIRHRSYVASVAPTLVELHLRTGAWSEARAVVDHALDVLGTATAFDDERQRLVAQRRRAIDREPAG